MPSENLLTELKNILLEKYGLTFSDKDIKELALFILNTYEVLLGVDND